MLSPDEARQALSRFFRRRPVADLDALFAVRETQARRRVFRRLSALGCFSSYSHAGRDDTLRDIPPFDPEGLWRYVAVGFSRYGALKSTVEPLVAAAEAGRTPHALHVGLHVRVHNTLPERVRGRRIGREPIGGQYVYISAAPDRGRAQLVLRRQRREGIAKAASEAPPAVVVDVLLVLIQSGRGPLDAERVAERLAARGLAVTVEQVEAVFQR